MSSSSNKKTNRSASNNKKFCSIFGIKAAIIIFGFILLVAVLSLVYLSSWTIVTKHKYALFASAYLYALSIYLLLISTIITSLAIIALFVTAWTENGNGLKFVRKI